MNVLVLRTCNQDMTSYGGFKWPTSGPVSCFDWKPTHECGNGLHGLLWGVGSGSLLNFDGKWLVVSVPQDTIIDLGGKVKFPAGEVVYCGDRKGATDYIAQHAPIDSAIVGRFGTVGDNQSVTVGYEGTATAGIGGTAIVGNYGTATAGNWGTATAGNCGTATAGHEGTATAGYEGTATAGYGGIIRIDYYDGRRRTLIGYIGETLDSDGVPLKPNTPYQVTECKFKEKKLY